ncbi:MAG: RNA 2',3'-cyclic phosphodiesterase [Thermodesulfobacteriota bacterium]|nr:RNA 2',3'-cyclic phosphodiesterase [Thermodesulfobacteriota bacterium]
MGDKIRTFIAISLPDGVLQAIGEAQERLRQSRLDIRWVRKEGIHLTLKFLGDIDRAVVEKLEAAMGRATKGIAPFTLIGKGIGVFPDLRRARVIWTGLSGDVQALMALHRNLESELKGLGFPKEKRSFKGHLTLGRAKGSLDTTRLLEALEGLDGFKTESFVVPSLVLFQSDLRPQGAIYTRLAEAPLVSA